MWWNDQNWTTAQQNEMWAKWRLISACAARQSDQSSLSAWRSLGSLIVLGAYSEDSDQTGRMPRLIWVIAGRTGHFVGFVMLRLELWLKTCSWKSVAATETFDKYEYILIYIYMQSIKIYPDNFGIRQRVNFKLCTKDAVLAIWKLCSLVLLPAIFW